MYMAARADRENLADVAATADTAAMADRAAMSHVEDVSKGRGRNGVAARRMSARRSDSLNQPNLMSDTAATSAMADLTHTAAMADTSAKSV